MLSGVKISQPQWLKWHGADAGENKWHRLASWGKAGLTQRLVQTACLLTQDTQVYNGVLA